MNDNITIENCVFKNVYRGVGTHNYFKNLYQTNIKILNCTFENITDCAISAVNFKNIEVKGNKFLNCKYSAFIVITVNNSCLITLLLYTK